MNIVNLLCLIIVVLAIVNIQVGSPYITVLQAGLLLAQIGFAVYQ